MEKGKDNVRWQRFEMDGERKMRVGDREETSAGKLNEEKQRNTIQQKERKRKIDFTPSTIL